MYLSTRRNDMYNALTEMFRSPFFTGTDNVSTSTKLMRTNVKEKNDSYELAMELPGVTKENIQAELKDGYLVVTATKASENTENDDDGKFIRKECFEGSCKRSFYVGDYLRQEDIKANYENGVLKLNIPKEPEPVPEAPKLITIQ